MATPSAVPVIKVTLRTEPGDGSGAEGGGEHVTLRSAEHAGES